MLCLLLLRLFESLSLSTANDDDFQMPTETYRASGGDGEKIFLADLILCDNL